MRRGDDGRDTPMTRRHGTWVDRLVQQSRASVWVLPLLAATAQLVVALLLTTIRPQPDGPLAEWAFPADASVASSVLQTVATSAMTAASLTFSLTVVALQLASQQFSPRLLRSFARDRLIQATAALLIGAFLAGVATLRTLDPERPVPSLAVAFVLLLGMAAAVMLLVFIGHMTRSLRIDSMMSGVHDSTVASALAAYPPRNHGPAGPTAELPGPAGGVVVTAAHSGFVRAVRPGPIVGLAVEHNVFIRLGVRPGDGVVRGTPIASVWSCDGSDVRADELSRRLLHGVSLGFERTEEQDVAFGFRQLVDVAVKAMSSALNDPTTAAEAIGYCADLLVLLQGRRLGAQVKHDRDGVVRLVLPDRDHRYYLELACAQIRRFASSEPAVLGALLRMLRDCAVNACDDDQRAHILEQTELILEQMSDSLLPHDAASLRDLGARVRHALRGDLDAAYRDRAGETRVT